MHTCKIRDCDKPGNWTITTTGHPNGDINVSYCAAHVRMIPWDDSPSTYTTTITGPHTQETRHES